jgi:S1-C subfamily serine protease
MEKKYDLKYLFVLLLFLTVICFQASTFLFNKKIDVEKTVKLSVVEVKAETNDDGDIYESFGSAVFVKDDGTLVTNAHVVTFKLSQETVAFENIYIRFSTENDYRAVTLEKYDLEKDLAVLKLSDKDCKFKAIKIGDSSKLKFNDEVYALGNLNKVGVSLTKGVISNPKINVEYNGNTREVIQSDLVIAEGNSGGALVDDEGKLIGITTFRLKDGSNDTIYGICYSIPVNIVVEYIK